MTPPLLAAVLGLTLTMAPGPAGVDSYVRAQMAAGHVPGLALGIVHGDQVERLQGFGTADDTGRPVTPRTPFVIASVTKSFTALATMQLVERGQVQLDAPVRRYLPWFTLADAGASSRISVRDLLTQTSGIPAVTGSQICRYRTSEEAVRSLATVQPSAPPGRSFQYTDANYVTLGVLVQAVSGQPYADYVRQHILAPLAMTDTYVSLQDAESHGLATGYQTVFGLPIPAASFPPALQACLPAGFIVSTAQDLTHWLIAQLDQGRYDGRSVLSPAGIAEMHRAGTSTGLPARDETGYGMGWFVGTSGGATIVQHDGDDSAFHSHLLMLPGQQVGVVVLMNVGAGGLWYRDVRGDIAPAVLQLAEGGRPRPPAPFGPGLWLVVPVVAAGLVVQVALAARWLPATLRRRRQGAWLRGRPTLGSLAPALLHLAWAAVVLVLLLLIASAANATVAALLARAPDLGYLSLAGIAFGLAVCAVRAVAALRHT